MELGSEQRQHNSVDCGVFFIQAARASSAGLPTRSQIPVARMEWLSLFPEHIRQREQSSAVQAEASSSAVPLPMPATSSVSAPALVQISASASGGHNPLADAVADRKALYREVGSDDPVLALQYIYSSASHEDLLRAILLAKSPAEEQR
jgi:hypothetical protein